MKKHTLEIYRAKDVWTGYGLMVELILMKNNINIDDKIMEWANENNVVIYQHKLIQRHEQYNPIRLKYNEYGNEEYPTGDQILEIIIYYYDKNEVPPEYNKLVNAIDMLENWKQLCNQN